MRRRVRATIDAVRPVTAVALGCLLVGVTGFTHWFSAFGMGMSVSDELPPYAGGTTPLGAALLLRRVRGRAHRRRPRPRRDPDPAAPAPPGCGELLTSGPAAP